MGPKEPDLSLFRSMRDEAGKDRIEAIQDRVKYDTRENLIRYGTLKAFAGTGGGIGGARNPFGALPMVSGF